MYNLKWAIKQTLISQIKSDKYIQESSTIIEQKKFKEWIKKLTYEQTLILVFDKKYIKVSEQKIYEPKIRERDNFIQKFLKYGFATLVSGATGYGVGNQALKRMNGTMNIFKMAGIQTPPIQGKHLAYGIGVGLTLAMMVAYYKFRRNKDQCYKKCYGDTSDNPCYQECVVHAANSVLNEIESEFTRCHTMPNKEKCKEKLEKLEKKWAEIKYKAEEKLKRIKYIY
jgi:hypothetical protein